MLQALADNDEIEHNSKLSQEEYEFKDEEEEDVTPKPKAKSTLSIKEIQD